VPQPSASSGMRRAARARPHFIPVTPYIGFCPNGPAPAVLTAPKWQPGSTRTATPDRSNEDMGTSRHH
jgi:hypothetical protein